MEQKVLAVVTGIATVGVGTLQAGHGLLGLHLDQVGEETLLEVLEREMIDEGESVIAHLAVLTLTLLRREGTLMKFVIPAHILLVRPFE